ncbi:hypothetical protein AG1IA_08878 [Rhizoctonia solani AG-1 IA]|uniref:Uncharacterized protein n=1 Tax=Thanatephorus cucumeris (strain AG1-IA) TaxID=983506 RepID=L8WK23_THACA|nr:hypothetical protein AG1IA_08878 [Rhizoctonia solani AG-1 IA]
MPQKPCSRLLGTRTFGVMLTKLYGSPSSFSYEDKHGTFGA